MADLSYSGSDDARGKANPSKIPIDGNVRNGLLTLRNALGLYCEYLSGAAPTATAQRDASHRQGALRFGAAAEKMPLLLPVEDGTPESPSINSADDGAPHCDDHSDPTALAAMSTRALLQLHAATLRTLALRHVIRTENVVGEYGEWLFARAFNLTLADPSIKSYDAIDQQGRRWQIKARRDAGRGGVERLGITRNLSEDGFDLLAAVIFEGDFAVRRAVILPRDLIAERAVFSDHQRGNVLTLGRSLLADPRVRVVTDDLRAAAA